MGHQQLQQHLQAQGFPLPDLSSPVSIHSPTSIAFYKNILKADTWILDLLMHGLTLNFKYPPSSYEEDNNQSAKSNLPAVREKVKSWVADGHVTELDTKPFCCITLSLITKIDNSTGKIKHWPCIDMSRYLNPLSLDDPIKLDDLSVAEHLVDRNDFMASLDLKNMFFHVQLHPEFKKSISVLNSPTKMVLINIINSQLWHTV